MGVFFMFGPPGWLIMSGILYPNVYHTVRVIVVTLLKAMQECAGAFSGRPATRNKFYYYCCFLRLNSSSDTTRSSSGTVPGFSSNGNSMSLSAADGVDL